MNAAQIQEVLAELKARTQTVSYAIELQTNVVPTIFDSKFGGVPYWDTKQAYPADEEDNPLMLLAQINFDRFQAENPLPKQGMLQFFIGLSDVFGADFDNADVQNTFRVVYHESVDYTVTPEWINELIAAQNIPVCTDPDTKEYSPVWKECAVRLEKATTSMNPADYRFDQLFFAIAQEKFGETFENTSVFNILGEDTYDELADNGGHRLLGYPYFTQFDPREYTENYQYYDTLLFQMDSEFGNGEDYILWGDAGVANFFINHADLQNRDFSKVLYNWDCC